MDLIIPKRMVNVKELKHKKEQLKTEIETTEAMFKQQIKEDLQHYNDFVTEYYSMERNIDYSEMIFNSAIEIIKAIQQHNLEQVKMCVAQIFSTENVILNFDDLIKVDYVTKTLLDKIKRNRTQQHAQISCIRDNELYVCVNVVNSYIRFMTQDDILSNIHIVCPRKITDEEAKYFANDFTFGIDIDKIDHYCLVKKLDVIYDYISSNKFSMEDLVALNSFLTHKERGDICVLKKGCLKSAESLQYSRKFVMKLNLLVFENYECKKMRGLLLSYFYAISPGLVGVYCKQDCVDSVDMYYLEWIEHLKKRNVQ